MGKTSRPTQVVQGNMPQPRLSPCGVRLWWRRNSEAVPKATLCMFNTAEEHWDMANTTPESWELPPLGRAHLAPDCCHPPSDGSHKVPVTDALCPKLVPDCRCSELIRAAVS